MAFRFAWGSLPNVPVTNVRVFLEGSGINLPAVQFGVPGTIDSRDLIAPFPEFDFRLFLAVGRDQFFCEFERMGADDILSVVAFSPTTFVGSTFHSPGRRNRCTVRCSNGTSGQGCVQCVDGSLIVRVCC
jgi:hypothetical protein